MQVGLAEIQKNIALLTNLTEPLHIIDKRRKQIIATVYPRLTTHHAQRLAGKYQQRVPASIQAVPLAAAREAALQAAFKERTLLINERLKRRCA